MAGAWVCGGVVSVGLWVCGGWPVVGCGFGIMEVGLCSGLAWFASDEREDQREELKRKKLRNE